MRVGGKEREMIVDQVREERVLTSTSPKIPHRREGKRERERERECVCNLNYIMYDALILNTNNCALAC